MTWGRKNQHASIHGTHRQSGPRTVVVGHHGVTKHGKKGIHAEHILVKHDPWRGGGHGHKKG